MTVTSVDRRRGSLYQVSLDDGTVQTIDKNVWDESAYDVGSSLSVENWERLLERSRVRRARDRALYLLSIKDYPAKKLLDKLTDADIDRTTAEDTVNRMIELGLVDDARYAERLARDLFTYKHFSARRIEQELRQKGIARDIAADAVANFGGAEQDLQQAIDFLRKKYYNKIVNEDARRKTAQAMLRAGFDYDTVRRAIDACLCALDDKDEDQ